jgi:hypothetical protein
MFRTKAERLSVMAIEKCHECGKMAEEKKGRWLILGEKEKGFGWMFLCIQCVRDWRERGLGRERLSRKEIAVQLDKEYPLN